MMSISPSRKHVAVLGSPATGHLLMSLHPLESRGKRKICKTMLIRRLNQQVSTANGDDNNNLKAASSLRAVNRRRWCRLIHVQHYASFPQSLLWSVAAVSCSTLSIFFFVWPLFGGEEKGEG